MPGLRLGLDGIGHPVSEPLDSMLRGYSPRYTAAVSKLLGVEGGRTNDPLDHGGETAFGVSLRFLRAEAKADPAFAAKFDLDMSGDIDGRDVRLLTKGDAVWIYNACFWKPLGCDAWPAPIGEMLFDQAVNGGAVASCKLLQRAINSCNAHVSDAPRLVVDGKLGPRTHLALDKVLEHPGLGMSALAEAYRQQARARYRAIVADDPSQALYLDGWLNRADALGADA